MKPVAITSVLVLAASLTLAAAPIAEYYKLDLSRPPTPAYIVNLPDTRVVSGTVNAGSQPFYADGAVGVTTVPVSTSQPVLLELLVDPIVLGSEPTVIGTLDTRGFSSISFLALSNSAVSLFPKWRFSDDEPFGEVHDVRPSQGKCWNFVESGYGDRVTCGVGGPQLELSIASNSGKQTTVTSVRVYLTP